MSVVVLAGTLFIGQSSASAATTWAPDHFKVCWSTCDVYVEGDITWGNRTAHVTGKIFAYGARTSVYFDGFAGAKKVDSNIVYGTGGGTPFSGFDIGDPNLVGGINRIRTQVCVTSTDGDAGCGGQWNDIRD